MNVKETYEHRKNLKLIPEHEIQVCLISRTPNFPSTQLMQNNNRNRLCIFPVQSVRILPKLIPIHKESRAKEQPKNTN
ncbi:unnamed protein product [Tenebrio molitor]|nr:unnamed protein product [Tenebrio molitor]